MRNGSKIILGIILIFLGMVFLADNLGWDIADKVWEGVARFWPTIIIYVGASRIYRGLRLKK